MLIDSEYPIADVRHANESELEEINSALEQDRFAGSNLYIVRFPINSLLYPWLQISYEHIRDFRRRWTDFTDFTTILRIYIRKYIYVNQVTCFIARKQVSLSDATS